MRDLDEDARAVAGARVAAGGAAMREAPQDLEPHLDGAVRWPALQVDDEPEPTGVVLVGRIVEAGMRHEFYLYQRNDALR